MSYTTLTRDTREKRNEAHDTQQTAYVIYDTVTHDIWHTAYGIWDMSYVIPPTTHDIRVTTTLRQHPPAQHENGTCSLHPELSWTRW